MIKSIALTSCLLLLLLPLSSRAQTLVYLVTVNGSINPASAQYIHDALAEAGEDGAGLFVLKLDTPGGLLSSTRSIVSDFLSSDIPIVVYVSPRGGQAASAGAFITMSANIAVMAPGTNIGAAHPVTIGEGDNTADSVNIPMTKATNDAAAFARTIAEHRNRNIEWAEQSVRQSVSITETEALSNNVIDLIADDLDHLLELLDGWITQTAAGEVTLDLEKYEVLEREMSFKEEFLDVLSDPNIAYILMMLGIYGLFFELYNPGSVFPGVVGGICLILAFYSMNTLPINYAGLALILFGVILFLLEIKIVSHGLLSIGGVISLFLGSVMLIDTPSGIEVMEISLSVIITVTACSAAFFLFIITKAVAIMKRKPTTGVEGMVGERGVVIDALDPEGKVMLHGEYWNARSESVTIAAGEKIVVKAVNDMLLTVDRES